MKGISFLTPMVLALLNTKPGVWPAEPIDPNKPFKWQTRRIVKPQPTKLYFPGIKGGKPSWPANFEGEALWSGKTIQSKYRPGEIVYVKEGLYLGVKEDTFLAPTPVIYYDADGANSGKSWRWKRSKIPPIFMPRDLARMELEIKAVRVERLQDITEADAVAEGIEHLFSAEEMSESPEMMVYANSWKNYLWHGHDGLKKKQVDSWPHQFSSYQSAVKSYSSLWESISGPGSWDSNPWVFAYEFARVK